MLSGLSPVLCKIIQSFLADRLIDPFRSNQMECFHIAKTSVQARHKGVVFPTFYYLAYINDMPTHPGNNKPQFADDSLFYRTHRVCKLASKTFDSYFHRIAEFFNRWILDICERKSEMLNIVGRCTDTNRRLRSDAKTMQVTINKKKMEKVDSMRYLGQWFMKNSYLLNMSHR